MTTPAVNSASTASVSAGAAVSAPAVTSAPHVRDSLEMREPTSNTGYCSSISARIGAIWSSIKTKILQLIHYFFPRPLEAREPISAPASASNRPEFFTRALNAIQDPQHREYQNKLECFNVFLSSRVNHLLSHPTDWEMMNACIQEMLAALPPDLAEAIICRARRSCRGTEYFEGGIVVFVPGEGNIALSARSLNEAVHSLLGLYPDCFWADKIGIIFNANNSSQAKAEALKTLVHFDLNVRFDRFNLRSTMTEENWKGFIREAARSLPEDVKDILFRKMWELSQPRDGRMAFLANPRSDQAKQALEETLQVLRPEFFTPALNTIQDPRTNYQIKLRSFDHFLSRGSSDLIRCLTELYYPDASARIDRTRNMLDACTQELFAALPSDLAEAIICKAREPSSHPIPREDREDRIEISLPGQGNTTLFRRQLKDAVHSLLSLYPDSFFTKQFIIFNDPDTSLREKTEAFQALINFNPNVRFDRFDLHSTETEEGWKATLRNAIEELPEEIKRTLFEKMGNLAQRDGRRAFLENPRSDQAKQAVEETLQALSNP